ncbi:Major Facilitator Superfamily [Geosmithia morbida]|uniref:Major Facilitator Superfamily n=1 Tax=Geosmithia morbida TaxID=1094350 RepID=A0A9P5D2W7_9HYPO|nr:Major Facilitator Superfamily [Geosmithia morbida]KAF4121906.1 Major Facilitator Superfamily [Geosmithia morbida]
MDKSEKVMADGGATPRASDDISAHDGHLIIDQQSEKRLVRKLDIWIAPVMTLIFLTAYLDRSNIGNAASAGMTEQLGMSSGDLGNAVTLFYVTYVAFEVPCSLVLKKFHPSRMIPLLMFGWSIVLIGTGFMHTRGQLYASRLLLGLFESGMFPCLALYLSTFYKPGEQALRVSYLFVSSALSGSFGGLFAYALLKMDGVAGMAGWRWLFIIEGCASVAVSVFVFFFLPDNFETARFLNAEEKNLMRVRAQLNARYNGKPDFDWAEVKNAALDPKLYISCWSQFMADICSFGLSSFLPLIIKSFGYDTVTTQLLTVPVFFWASCAYIVVSWMSDRWRRRAFFMMPACLITAVGYAVNLGVAADKRGPLYFSTFLIAPGVYVIVGLNCAWLLNSHAPYYKRAMAIGMNQSIGNCAGIVVGQIFRTTQNGKYVMGLSSSLAAVILAIAGHASLYMYLRRQNIKRDHMSQEERQAEIDAGKTGDFHPDYRYAL